MSGSSGCDIKAHLPLQHSLPLTQAVPAGLQSPLVTMKMLAKGFLMLASAMIIEKGLISLRAAVTVGAAATRSTAAIATNSKANLLEYFIYCSNQLMKLVPWSSDEPMLPPNAPLYTQGDGMGLD
ncbi:hypothetical protein V6N13_092451 [Hibiscus sabdariffa]